MTEDMKAASQGDILIRGLLPLEVAQQFAILSRGSELSRLARAPAKYTSVRSKSECHSSTRIETQESLHKHLKEAGNRFVWLRGSPGTGKTAVSMSVASALEGILAASFFWDKNQTGTGLDSIEQFPSTLAHQLASFNKDFKADTFDTRLWP
ncbi:uncharacterized protein EI90DRAFT_3126044 [Cantharellus anzutake]|uniref:uncharacterized protein n=1 Tax=Cantharellus anzutake TaxID=1750568 RepID=UPI0019078BC8|nr:uncharacterized protein EI90DRAFT_3126044 [Cantharellus anzutake]KAF8328589.1 hypothetical protein EI90DRAFT_3126044 [Cantharellus anzutake]